VVEQSGAAAAAAAAAAVEEETGRGKRQKIARIQYGS
jgi:hypothetical protein